MQYKARNLNSLIRELRGVESKESKEFNSRTQRSIKRGVIEV